MIELKKREKIFAQRIDSERDSLLSDIAIWKEALPAGSVIRHHVQQFEDLATRILSGLETLYDHERWPDLDPTVFQSAIVGLLTGKWVAKLRPIILQRMPGNPYASALQELDGLAEDAYDRLRLSVKEVGKREDLSNSPPLVYVGPLARLLLFYEHAPYLIGTPLGSVNERDEFARDVSRQTIPHEAADAIFEQLPEVLEELRFETGRRLAGEKPTRKQSAIHAVILNWLGEIVADMAGTALAGEAFARSAAVILAMPDNLVGSTDAEHPEPTIRSSVHEWTLRQISAEPAKKFQASLNRITSPQLDKRFEPLPALISVSLGEVQTELLRLVELTWNTPLKSLDNHSLGEVFLEASRKQISRRSANELFPWGQPIEGEDELFRLLGRIDPVNPLPGPDLFIREFCCQVLKIQDCCDQTIN